MSWDALGALGEIVGAIAVVLTLGYLALQMRNANKAAMSEGTYSGTKLAATWRTSIMGNPELAAIAVKANEGVELTKEERFQYHALSDDLIFACAVAYGGSAISGSFHETHGATEYFLSVVRENHGLRKEWERLRPIVLLISADFVKVVDDRMEAGLESLA